MLADLSLVNCYDTAAMSAEERDRVMLAAAKVTLKNLASFGIKERMADSQALFEHLFQLK